MRVLSQLARHLHSSACALKKQMLRITVIEKSEHAITFQVEGEVSGRWVAELRRACEEALSRDVRLTLDLGGVSFIDVDGIDLFRVLKERHIVLVNASPFIAEQLGDSQ